MISDVLFEAVQDIDRYLTEPVYLDVYSGELRARIEKLRTEMEEIRRELDAPPVRDEGLTGN